MLHVILSLALLLRSPVAVAHNEEASVSLNVDARDVALSFRHGRVQWRVEALDLLQLPVIESLDVTALAEQGVFTQELLNPPVDLEGERRFFLSVTIDW